MKRVIGIASLALLASCASMPGSEQEVVARSASMVPTGPWPTGDERGMANTIGAGTYMRCAWHLAQPGVKTYELSQVRSPSMPLSPFAGPYSVRYNPTTVIPGTHHGFNTEQVSGDPAQQGTQIDALGHFGALPGTWDGKSPNPERSLVYYGGYRQADVKPTPDSPLLRLGMEKAPPIVTTGVLLDAKRHVGNGQTLRPGQVINSRQIEAMLKAQGLDGRGILPGDVVYIYTGWSDGWQDPDVAKEYYTKAPGLSFDAAKYLGDRKVVVVALDTPFVDAVNEGQLQGKAGPPDGILAGHPFSMHHHMLTQMGVHLIENARLAEMANDRVYTACTMILPLRERGGAGSPVRPVAIGAPGK
jgi:kynurenine formamidase